MRNGTKPLRRTDDSEKKLIEMANQMIPGIHMSDRYRLHMVFQTPFSFYLDKGNLFSQIEKLSNEKLGFIIGQALCGKETLWRRSCITGYGKVSMYDDGGRESLLYLASIVITAAIYDILATENVLRIKQDQRVETVDYIPPPLLRNFVARVRLGQKI